MADDAAQVSSDTLVCLGLACSNPTRCTAQRWVVWVKRTDAKAAQYSAVRDVDPSVSVDELKARWLSDEKLDMRPSLVSPGEARAWQTRNER